MNIPNSTLRLLVAVILLCAYFSCKKPGSVNPSTASFDFSWQATSSDPDVYNFLFTTTAPAAADKHWDFGDGITAAGTSLTFHNYKSPGIYTVTLTVNNESVQKVLDVSLYLPHTFYYDGVELTDSALSFYTNVRPDSTFLWNFGDGNTSAEPEPKHTWHSPGSYTITLSVNGRVSKQSPLTIVNNPLYTHLMAGTRAWTHTTNTVINTYPGQPVTYDESFALIYVNPIKIGFADTVLNYDPTRSTDSVLVYGYDYWNYATADHHTLFVYYYRLNDSIHINEMRYVPPHWTSFDIWDTK